MYGGIYMNKSDLVKYVSDKTMITESDAHVIVDVFIRGIKEGLDEGQKVTVKNFGTFFLQTRKARKAVDPRNQEPVNVPAKTVVKFKSAKKLYDMVNG
jgi:nucleoid DNA-binding protein